MHQSPIAFSARHIGPSQKEIQEMLTTLGFTSLEELMAKVVPKEIRTRHKFDELGEGESEQAWLLYIRRLMGQNQLKKNLIGMGFYGTFTPPVIQRNILENPAWYTAYTPYQPEISQGRLEALLNFQTLVCDLTGMQISNSSLLDEGSAAAEAMAMAHALCKTKGETLLVDDRLHPHVIEVLKTRMEPMGLKMQLFHTSQSTSQSTPQSTPQSTQQWRATSAITDLFGVILGYPNTEGLVLDYQEITDWAHGLGALVIADVDILSLTLLKPPGEWGADIVIGNTQRFGVPMGFGGPHAAFLATREEYKRLMPGRLVGLSKDTEGNPALRLALQTREQHIRREKATSNICTAQVLLANMASMYAVYHGPLGLRQISKRISTLTKQAAQGLERMGRKIRHLHFFDTLVVETPKDGAIVFEKAQGFEMNLRPYSQNGIITAVGFSLDELCDEETVEFILRAFSTENVNKGSLSEKEKPDEVAAEKSAKKSKTAAVAASQGIPAMLERISKYLEHPVFNTHHSEQELTRYIFSLHQKDLSLVHSMIPLGSCTMKLNATSELLPVSWPEVNQLHPFAPQDQVRGMLKMIQELEEKLCDITGYDAVSIQPNGGSQGEYAGLLTLRKYFEGRKEAHRNICLIPSSAHGTNPASAVMAGFQVVVVNCDSKGNIDVADLKEKAKTHSASLGALMVTYPSTHGVFEEGIREICDIIHNFGGQVYMDGANMNALVGLCRPGEFGPDVGHLNLHKTFAIPHGGGGPGVGPVGVKSHLKPYLPPTITTTSGPYGSASILPISLGYIRMLGSQGLRLASEVSILSANYVAKKLSPYFPILYMGLEGLVAHECIIDLNPAKKSSGVDVTDVAKRLMDFGFHAPTMSWPVPGTLMIEPTESESKAELDRFIESMICIHKEIEQIASGKWDREKNPLKLAPHTAKTLIHRDWDLCYTREQAAYPLPWVGNSKYWPPCSRIDNAYGDRNLICSCPPVGDLSRPPVGDL